VEAVSTIIGVILILIALHDVFQTLLRPSSTGRLTHLIFRVLWRVGRRIPGVRLGGGAVMVIVTIGLWIALVAVGWALIYLPHVPDGFLYTGVDPSRYHPFVEALTFSFVALTTLGLGGRGADRPSRARDLAARSTHGVRSRVGRRRLVVRTVSGTRPTARVRDRAELAPRGRGHVRP
jgi:hypothetical protein